MPLGWGVCWREQAILEVVSFECYELPVEMVGSPPREELCGFYMVVQEKQRQDLGEV